MSKVSVIMITYNHEKFISEAISGILMQKCDFDVELIIADDKSPDDTETVVRSIIENHSKGHWIKYTKHETNKGMQENFVWASKQCGGKYIAMCEGDDYWTDPLKLQKQVDFLEANTNFVLVAGGYNDVNQNKKTENLLGQNEVFELSNICNKYYTKTLTLLFRNKVLDFKILKKYKYSRDVHLSYHLLKKGKGYYMNEVLGDYNRHEGGVFSSLNREKNFKIQYEIYDELYLHEKNAVIKKILFNNKIAFGQYDFGVGVSSYKQISSFVDFKIFIIFILIKGKRLITSTKSI